MKRQKSIFGFLATAALVLSGVNGWPGSQQSFGGITMTEVAPRIVTPNGDLKNDVIFFRFDSPLSGLPVESSILDIHGARVSDLAVNSNETALLWDGKDNSGQALPSGIYIYSIKIGQKTATGTIVVAR